MPDLPSILIAEDNRVMADVLRFNLARSGFSVTVASNGLVAVELLQAGAFDLVISDYQMPGMNGEELCRWMRSDPRYRTVPVLMCSAKGYELDASRLQEELDISRIFYKPFSPRDVVELVRLTLELQGSFVTDNV